MRKCIGAECIGEPNELRTCTENPACQLKNNTQAQLTLAVFLIWYENS